MRLYPTLMNLVHHNNRIRCAIACAEDETVLASVIQAYDLGLIKPILFGNKSEIEKILHDRRDLFEIIDSNSKEESCALAVQSISNGTNRLLMKGFVDTSVLLKAVLNKEWGIRDKSVLSHVCVATLPHSDKLYFISDSAMNILPDLITKKGIIENAVSVARYCGVICPKVGVLSAIEKVNEKMPSSVDASLLSQMAKKGEILNCTVDGPFAFDNAIDIHAAHHKGVTHPNAGECDVLIVPNIEAGNILYKSITYFSKGDVAGLVVGAKVPIILTSRADSESDKLNSIVCAILNIGDQNG
ncbi:MAG: bifunctional enoyl-CoA hydratase/phosphate acetyltransferase [Erysipelotrichaceae bacterium]|nr:bifunctional enoyl-CoA hydratase/phosphate acetyltransferase [Erysipelotrichaceae bacterium]